MVAPAPTISLVNSESAVTVVTGPGQCPVKVPIYPTGRSGNARTTPPCGAIASVPDLSEGEILSWDDFDDFLGEEGHRILKELEEEEEEE